MEPVEEQGDEPLFESEEEEETKGKGKRRVRDMDRARYPEAPSSCYREFGKEISFESVTFDTDGSKGQARPFNKSTFETRLQEFRQALPNTPLHITVWPEDPHGMF